MELQHFWCRPRYASPSENCSYRDPALQAPKVKILIKNYYRKWYIFRVPMNSRNTTRITCRNTYKQNKTKKQKPNKQFPKSPNPPPQPPYQALAWSYRYFRCRPRHASPSGNCPNRDPTLHCPNLQILIRSY